MRRTALPGLLVAAALVTAGCTGSDPAPEPPPKPSATTASAPAQPDLPDQVDAVGEVTEPAMEPVWLLRSTGTAESETYDVQDQGLLVDGDVVVHHVLDTVLGLSLSDGAEIWRSPVDMRGQTVGLAGTAVHGDHRWSFVYPDTASDDPDQRGEHLVTLDVRTGDVVADRVLGPYGSVDSLTSASGQDFLATRRGVFEITDRGRLARVLPASELGPGDAWVRRMVPVHDTGVLVLELADRTTLTTTAVVGLDTDSGRILWANGVDTFAISREQAGSVYLSPGDGRYVTRGDTRRSADGSIDDFVTVWTLDPRTGRVRATRRLGLDSTNPDDSHQPALTVSDIDAGNPAAMFPVGDDIVFEDGGGVSRYSPLTGRYRWTRDAGELQLRNAGTAGAGFSLGPTSPDGAVVYAGFSAGPSGDLVAIDLEDGTLAGRWALDDEQDAGLVTRPLMVLADDRMVLARNRSSRGDPTALDSEAKPLGPLNDLGLLRFPDLGDGAASR